MLGRGKTKQTQYKKQTKQEPPAREGFEGLLKEKGKMKVNRKAAKASQRVNHMVEVMTIPTRIIVGLLKLSGTVDIRVPGMIAIGFTPKYRRRKSLR